ncbi:MAG: P-loop NTPase [Elusimicrobia bacterium]|nr:P-loop NTPase [Elusimicrobiota bacterium]
MNLDPRTFAISDRIKNIKKIYAVTGFKGGVGKSTAACLLALALSAKGVKTGLLDLDFSGSSCHVILGVTPGMKSLFPSEIQGLTPPEVAGIKFMSLAYFTQNRAAHLRGEDVTNSIIELLAVTNWGNLDALILDMPPGISDAALDIMRLMPKAEMIAVVTSSILSQNLAVKALEFCKNSGVKTLGIIHNFTRGGCETGEIFAEFKCLAKLPYDKNFEASIGDIEALKRTDVYAAVQPAFENLL